MSASRASDDAPQPPEPQPELQEPAVEIHKPKAVHGWRELLNEIGVIVIGVLIALGAEQVVESLHWAHEVAEQRESLTEEAKDNLDSVVRRQRQQSCIDHRLAEIHALLERHAHGAPLGITGSFAKPTKAGASRGSWDIALAGQALPHMAQQERLKFSGIFGVFSYWQTMTDREDAIWSRLSVLQDADLLSDADWSTVRSAYAEAMDVNDTRRNFAAYILQQGQEQLGVRAEGEASNATFAALDRQICQPYLAVDKAK